MGKSYFEKMNTGNAGEYYVCAELSRRNILALMTSKSNPNFDIIATNQKNDRTIYIQVKTISEEFFQWRVSNYLRTKQNRDDLIVVLVDLRKITDNKKDVDFYVWKHDDLAERLVQDDVIESDTFGWKQYIGSDFEDHINNWGILGL